MVRCRSINILILAYLLGFAAVASPQLAYGATDDVEDLTFDQEIIPATPKPRPPVKSGKSPWTVGIIGGYGAALQGSKSFSTTDQQPYVTSTFNGSEFSGGLYFVNKWSSDMAFRMYLSYQNYKFTGTATEVGLPVGPKSITLSESMGAGGFDVLYYVWSKHTLWIAGGLEYARGLSLDITLDGTALPTAKEDFTNYFKFNASFGFDIPFGRFVITPMARVGDILTVKPMILTVEGQVALGYRL